MTLTGVTSGNPANLWSLVICPAQTRGTVPHVCRVQRPKWISPVGFPSPGHPGFGLYSSALPTSLLTARPAVRNTQAMNARVFSQFSSVCQGFLVPVSRGVMETPRLPTRQLPDGTIKGRVLRGVGDRTAPPSAHVSRGKQRGAPIHLVQATLGHSSVATTGRYLHARPNESSSKYLAV